MMLVLLILGAPYVAPSGNNPGTAVRQGLSWDGGYAWSVECTNCGGGSSSLVYVADAGVVNVNFPATQAVSGTVTANAGSGTMAVSMATAPTTPVTGAFWQTTQPVSAATLPLPSGASTDATLSQLFDGGIAALGMKPDGTLRAVSVDSSGVQWVRQIPAPFAAPANALSLPCNPVRRTNCR